MVRHCGGTLSRASSGVPSVFIQSKSSPYIRSYIGTMHHTYRKEMGRKSADSSLTCPQCGGKLISQGFYSARCVGMPDCPNFSPEDVPAPEVKPYDYYQGVDLNVWPFI